MKRTEKAIRACGAVMLAVAMITLMAVGQVQAAETPTRETVEQGTRSNEMMALVPQYLYTIEEVSESEGTVIEEVIEEGRKADLLKEGDGTNVTLAKKKIVELPLYYKGRKIYRQRAGGEVSESEGTVIEEVIEEGRKADLLKEGDGTNVTLKKKKIVELPLYYKGRKIYRQRAGEVDVYGITEEQKKEIIQQLLLENEPSFLIMLHEEDEPVKLKVEYVE